MQQLPILYTFIRCPWAMRARLALELMNIDYEHREVDLKNKPEHMLQVSPKGTVPVLILSDGRILEESLEIVFWAMPQPPADQLQEMNSLIRLNDGEFKQNNYRYKYSERYLDEGKTQEYYRSECEKFIKVLEQKLSAHKYLINDQITIADIAIFPLIRQFSKVDENWFKQANYPQVQRWLEIISNSDFFNKAMEKKPVFIES